MGWEGGKEGKGMYGKEDDRDEKGKGKRTGVEGDRKAERSRRGE